MGIERQQLRGARVLRLRVVRAAKTLPETAVIR